jgi:flavin reductase (DIM6/NTAB) family NADH-FMN oxidoreductase RutF
VITTVHKGDVHGMTANAFVSVSLDPPLVLISVDNLSRMHHLISQSGIYGVSVLSDDQEPLSRHFAGRPQEGLEVSFVWSNGVPLVAHTLARLVCEVEATHPAGDHTLFLGRVGDLDYEDGAPLLFHTGSYRSLKVQLSDYSSLNDLSWW